jgi:predicted DNA binding CopG/RHH family protein
MRKSKEHLAIEAALQGGTAEFLPWSEAKKYGEWARSQAKNKLISLRINEGDLNALKLLAAKKGKKYQTLIGEILHNAVSRALKAA